MQMLRPAAVAHWIFIPEESCFIARAPNRQRICESAQFASRIEHQLHASAEMAPECQHSLTFFPGISITPAVHLERAIAQFEALLGKIHIGLGARQPTVTVAVI